VFTNLLNVHSVKYVSSIRRERKIGPLIRKAHIFPLKLMERIYCGGGESNGGRLSEKEMPWKDHIMTIYSRGQARLNTQVFSPNCIYYLNII
jgi:hypothetical protein